MPQSRRHCAAPNPAIALLLQSTRPAGRVAELGSLDVMSLRLTFRFVPLFLPVIGFLLTAASPHCAGRLSLLLHGLPFAHVTKDDVLKHVHTDSMRNAGIVISDGRAVGWIYRLCSDLRGSFDSPAHPTLIHLIILCAWTSS